jgi:hypothetical protein
VRAVWLTRTKLRWGDAEARRIRPKLQCTAGHIDRSVLRQNGFRNVFQMLVDRGCHARRVHAGLVVRAGCCLRIFSSQQLAWASFIRVTVYSLAWARVYGERENKNADSKAAGPRPASHVSQCVGGDAPLGLRDCELAARAWSGEPWLHLPRYPVMRPCLRPRVYTGRACSSDAFFRIAPVRIAGSACGVWRAA